MTDTEKLAHAIWKAENPFWNEGNPFGQSVPWAWADADEEMRDVYRNLAADVQLELQKLEEQ